MSKEDNSKEKNQEQSSEEADAASQEQSIEETDAVVHDEDGNPRFRTEQLTKSMKPSDDSDDQSEDE